MKRQDYSHHSYHLSNLDTPLPLFHNIACRISCATESLSHCLNPQVVEVHFSSGIQSSDLDLLRQHVKDLVVCIPQVAHNGQQWVLRQLRQKKAKMWQKKRVKLWNLLNFLAWHRKYTRIRSRIKKKSCNMLGRYVKLLCVCTWYCSMCIYSVNAYVCVCPGQLPWNRNSPPSRGIRFLQSLTTSPRLRWATHLPRCEKSKRWAQIHPLINSSFAVTCHSSISIGYASMKTD